MVSADLVIANVTYKESKQEGRLKIECFGNQGKKCFEIGRENRCTNVLTYKKFGDDVKTRLFS